MARPRKCKQVGFLPSIVHFKPQGVALNSLETVELTVDELETIRLCDKKQLSQTHAAQEMNVHQSTLQRTLTRAREKISDALLGGKAIKITGGDYTMPNGDGTGPKGEGPRTGRKLGKCSGNEQPGCENGNEPRQGKGRRANCERRGQGRGRGCQHN